MRFMSLAMSFRATPSRQRNEKSDPPPGFPPFFILLFQTWKDNTESHTGSAFDMLSNFLPMVAINSLDRLVVNGLEHILNGLTISRM